MNRDDKQILRSEVDHFFDILYGAYEPMNAGSDEWDIFKNAITALERVNKWLTEQINKPDDTSAPTEP